MTNTAQPLHFFLGANTPQGVVSRFDQLADWREGWREYVLKGGPGTGKSTLMGRVAQLAQGRCGRIELIHCSSDADSLDGVILHDLKAAIADGTAPHAIEPRFPGAFEQLVDLSGGRNLCFRPLEPRLESWMYLAWKKYQVFSKPAEKFLETLQKQLG